MRFHIILLPMLCLAILASCGQAKLSGSSSSKPGSSKPVMSGENSDSQEPLEESSGLPGPEGTADALANEVEELAGVVEEAPLTFVDENQEQIAEGDLAAIEACMESWEEVPFTEETLVTKVKLDFNIFSDTYTDDVITNQPKLLLIESSVSLLSNTTYELYNPNGWYCFKGGFNILSTIIIEAHCDAQLASTNSQINIGGTTVGEQGQTNVNVLSDLAVTRVECD